MKQRLILIMSFVYVVNFVAAQKLKITGVVKDSIDLHNLPFASITINKINLIADGKGFFETSIDSSDVINFSLACSFIGYETKMLKKLSSNHLIIYLNPTIKNLSEIIVYSNGLHIVEKAIQNIKNNYPVKPIILTGIERSYFYKNKKSFYSNDAILDILIPPYTKGKQMQVSLLANKSNFEITSAYSSSDRVDLIGAYFIVPKYDFVYNSPDFLSLKKMNKYRYLVNDTIFIANRKCYVINFFPKKGLNSNKVEGTIIIDSLTLAFISFEITYYNISKINFLPIPKKSIVTSYKEHNGTWYLNEITSDLIAIHKRDSIFSKHQFISLSYDMRIKKSFSYKDLLQETDITQKTNKIVNDSTWSKYQKIINYYENTDSLIRITNPNVDTVHHKKKHPSLISSIKKYYYNNNYRFSFVVSKIPVNPTTVNPANSNFKKIATYTIGFCGQLRIYKEFFFQFEGSFNGGLGEINTKLNSYSVLFNKIVNQNKRPISFSPVMGITQIKINDNSNADFSKAVSFQKGITISLEATHIVLPFFFIFHHSFLKKTGFEYRNIQASPYSFGMGLTLKFR